MGWNGSTQTGETGGGRGSARVATSRPKFNVKALVAGLVVVIVGGAAAWWFLGREARPERVQPRGESQSSSPLEEVKPQISTNGAAQAKRVKTPEEKRAAEIKYFEDKYGTNMPAGIKAHVYYLKNPPKVHRPKTAYGFFRHPSERQIASVIAVEPGTFMLEPVEYGESFNKDFLASMLDKTEILETDDEETRAVKAAVADMKKEILACQKAEGKLPNEIINEHMKALYELSRFEQNLQDELNQLKNNPDVSDREIEDLFAAANKMRVAKGLPEQKIPNFSKRSIRLQKQLAKKKAKQ